MDVQTTSTIVNSAATAVYAVIAFFTLRHLSRESGESRRPHIVVYTEGAYAIRSSYSKTDGLMLGAFGSSHEEDTLDLSAEAFPIVVSNAGGGAALHVRLKWSCDGLDLAKLLLELERKYAILSERSEDGWVRIGSSIYTVIDEDEDIPYLAATAAHATTRNFGLPAGLERRLELMLVTRTLDKSLEDIRKVYLNVECQYSDRFGKSYLSHYRFRIAPQAGRTRHGHSTLIVGFVSEKMQ